MSDSEKQRLIAAEARVKQQTTHSGVDEIRALMNELDIRISRLEDITPEEALEVLDMFDRVADKLESIQQLGTPLPSEYSQFESILSHFLSQGSKYVKKVGGKQELEALRLADIHKEEYWWWRIDEVVAKDRMDRIKRWMTISLIWMTLTARWC